jgi:hypothetical protein
MAITEEKQKYIDQKIQEIKDRTPEDIRKMWTIQPYYNEEKGTIVFQSPRLRKDGTLRGGTLQQIASRERAIEVDGYRKAAVRGMLRGSQAENRREAYSKIVEKQTERALSDDGNVQAAVFVAKAIGAFARVEEKREEQSGVQINISPEIAREILDRMNRAK